MKMKNITAVIIEISNTKIQQAMSPKYKYSFAMLNFINAFTFVFSISLIAYLIIATS